MEGVDACEADGIAHPFPSVRPADEKRESVDSDEGSETGAQDEYAEKVEFAETSERELHVIFVLDSLDLQDGSLRRQSEERFGASFRFSYATWLR